MGKSQVQELKGLEKENFPPQEDHRGSRAGQADPEGEPRLPKAEGLTLADLRQAVIPVRQKLGSSEQRTCRTISVAGRGPPDTAASQEAEAPLSQGQLRHPAVPQVSEPYLEHRLRT